MIFAVLLSLYRAQPLQFKCTFWQTWSIAGICAAKVIHPISICILLQIACVVGYGLWIKRQLLRIGLPEVSP